MVFKTSLLSLALFVTIAGCSNSDQSNNTADNNTVPDQRTVIVDTNVIKVYVDETGLIMANGNSISLANLDSFFSKLRANNGTVHYSRANAQGEPPAESMKVMELVVKYELPIKLFTDNTFSAIVTPN